jgi:hypothetical protein
MQPRMTSEGLIENLNIMKIRRLFSTLLLLLLVAAAFAQTRETRNVGTFTSISYGIPGKLIFRQGSPQKVELSGSQDLLKEVKTEVQSSKLVIEVKGKWSNWNWNKGDELTVYVTVPNLEGLKVSGSGNAEGENTITASNFWLDVSGSGNATINVQATDAIDANISGSGNLELTGKCSSFKSKISGSGDMELDIAVGNRAVFEVSGSGGVKAKGSADEIKTSISGSSRISAENFMTNRADIHISGSGDISIAVKDEIDANISGSGNVRYKGNPSKVNSHASGSGHVSKM